MTKSELKQLIREVVEEVKKSDIYDVQVYLPNRKNPEIIVPAQGTTRNDLIEQVMEYLDDGFELMELHPKLYDGYSLRDDLIFKIVKHNASSKIDKIKMQIRKLEKEAGYLSYEEPESNSRGQLYRPEYTKKLGQIEDLQKKLKKLTGSKE